MTFEAREQSLTDGQPVELFTFAREYQRWRYTSADREIVTLDGTFLPRTLSRSEIETSPERVRSNITITAQRDLEVADLFRVSPPTLAVTCIIQQRHMTDTDAQVVTLWTGRISAVEFNGPAALITLEPINASMKRIGLRRIYQKQCPHVLYGNACKANREVFRIDGVVDSVGGASAVVPQAALHPAGHFSGGFLEWDIEPGIVERRFIGDHFGASLGFSSSSFGLLPGQAVKLYPGCDHKLETCADKFSNAVNYGGFPFFPTKNPFGGDPIF